VQNTNGMNGYPMNHRPGTNGQPMPWRAMVQFMSEGLPVAAVAHSYHVDALTDPQLREDPTFQEFSLIELNELHHQIGAMGAMIRLSQGDPSALRSLGTNLAGFLQNREAALATAAQFPPAVAENPAVQQVMRLTELSNQQIVQNWPVLQQALTMAAGPAPGPLLVAPHHP